MKNDGVRDITPKGLDYLNNVRNESVWSKTKERIKPMEQVTFDLISEVAKSYLLSKLGL